MGKADEWDFVAGAWEFVPSRPEHGVVKRAEFAHSSWSAEALLDDAGGELSSFVRLQVAKRPGEYTVNLYRINYATWEISVLAHSKPMPLTGRGAGAGKIYLSSREGMLVMDQRTGRTNAPSVPCDLLSEISTNAWIVRAKGADRGTLLFDPSRNVFGPRVKISESDHARSLNYHLSPSRRFLVNVQNPPDDASGFPRDEDTRIKVYDLETGESFDHVVRTFIYNGSGVQFIYPYFRDWFSGPDELRVQSGLPIGFPKPTAVLVSEATFDLRTRSRSDRKVDSLRKEDRAGPLRHRPAYLGVIEDVADEDRALAEAFLRHKGITWKKGGWSPTSVGYNADGTRFFVRIFSGEQGNRLFLGDLAKDTLLEIPVPLELQQDNAMNIIWVSK